MGAARVESDPARGGARLTRAAFLRLAGAAGLGLTAGPLVARAAAGEAGGGAPGDAARAMRTRPIPATGEPLPVVGLGTWQQFDVAAGAEELGALREVLARLFAGGGSVIDSSPMYGAAEARVGELLSALGAHDRAFVATKVWTRGRESGIAQMTRSAERLQSPVIDLMQVHNLLDLDTHLPVLREWKQAGRIRYLGVTHYTSSALDDLARVVEGERPDFVQLPYSIDMREAEARLLPLARERGVAVLVNVPYGSGAVFRRVRGRKLPGWARAFCASWGQFFLKYLLAEPAVTCVIPGTSNPAHMADNLGAGYGRLPEAAERRRMLELWRDL